MVSRQRRAAWQCIAEPEVSRAFSEEPELPQTLKAMRFEASLALSTANFLIPMAIGITVPFSKSSTGKKHYGKKLGKGNNNRGNQSLCWYREKHYSNGYVFVESSKLSILFLQGREILPQKDVLEHRGKDIA